MHISLTVVNYIIGKFEENEDFLSKLANYSPILTKIFSFGENVLPFSHDFLMIFVSVCLCFHGSCAHICTVG